MIVPDDSHPLYVYLYLLLWDIKSTLKLDARGLGTAADGVNEVEAIPNDVKALDADNTDILDPGGAGKLLFVSEIWTKLVQAKKDDLDFAHVTHADDDDEAGWPSRTMCIEYQLFQPLQQQLQYEQGALPMSDLRPVSQTWSHAVMLSLVL